MLSIRCKKRSSQLSHPEPSRYKMASASAKWFSLMWEGRRNAAFHCNSPCPRTFGGSLILDLISFTCKDVPYKNPIVVGQFGRHYLDLILVKKCAFLGHRLFENPQRFKLLFHQTRRASLICRSAKALLRDITWRRRPKEPGKMVVVFGTPENQ